jgi:hypothetical protein
MKNGCDYYKNATIIVEKIGRSLFVFIAMRINEHQKKGCDKVVDSEGNPLKLKLYPPLKNVVEGVYFVKGGNILEYRAKANAFSKLRNSRPLTTLALQPV